MTTLQLKPNIPATLSLSNVEGELDGSSVNFQLTDGRTWTVSCSLAAKVNMLDLRPGETFGVLKKWSGERRDPVEYTVWLTPESEKRRAQEETTEQPPDDLTPILAHSVELARNGARPRMVERRPVASEAPTVRDLGTGTTGPIPQTAPKSRPRRIEGRIPYNIAFREVTSFVIAELNATNEKWEPQAKQDLISTILIAAAKQGLLEVWERP